MEDKTKRHEALKKLLTNDPFSCQEEVVSAMKKIGFAVTQSSISRDFRELKVIKIGGHYLPASQITKSKGRSTFQQLVEGFDPAGPHLLVVKTTPGAASIVAEKIDVEDIPGVVGTIAGDNTIFVATKSNASHSKIINRIKEF